MFLINNARLNLNFVQESHHPRPAAEQPSGSEKDLVLLLDLIAHFICVFHIEVTWGYIPKGYGRQNGNKKNGWGRLKI